MRKLDDYELAYMIQEIEASGYVVRKPSEAELETVLEIVPNFGNYSHYEIGIRVDAKFNGRL